MPNSPSSSGILRGKNIYLPLDKLDKCSNVACNNSSSDAKLRVCSACGEVTYCSNECQRADWKTHKTFCGQTDRIDLNTFYPFLALVRLLCHVGDETSQHPALLHQIVNNPLSEESLVLLPTGGGARLVVLGDALSVTEAGTQEWCPSAPSDRSRDKLLMRIANEGKVLPSLLALSIALVAEIYTTTGIPKDEDPVFQLSGRRRVRLSYNHSPIADIGIAHGSVDVKDSHRLAYYKMGEDKYFVVQDPEDHYWMYFKTLAGNEYFLDFGMLAFDFDRMPYVLKHSQVMGFNEVQFAPAFFYDHRFEKSFPLIEQMHYSPKKKVSILRNKKLRELSLVNSFETEPGPNDIPIIRALMEEISGKDSFGPDMEKDLESVVECIPEAIASICKCVLDRLYKKFPEELQFAHETHPEEDRSALEERADKVLKQINQWNKKLKRGTMTPEKWVEQYRKHTERSPLQARLTATSVGLQLQHKQSSTDTSTS